MNVPRKLRSLDIVRAIPKHLLPLLTYSDCGPELTYSTRNSLKDGCS
jgi:hypothetical protein